MALLHVDPLLIEVPTEILTARLLLRPFRAGDGAVLHEALAESLPALRQFLWFLPWVAEDPTPASAEARCRRCEANFIARADLPYLAFARGSGRLVASVGLHRTDWQLPKTELGYWVRSSEGGQGYAAECVNALVAWAFEGLEAQRVELVTDEGNTASRRVAERCGFVLEGTLHHMQRAPDGSLRNSCMYARLPPGTRTGP
jgi:RimJ/RimL family protein N-acetyltransferase